MSMRFSKVILIGILLTSMSTLSHAQLLEGTMHCKIKQQSIQQINDGEAELYNSFTGDLKVGDSFWLTYGLSNGNVFRVNTGAGLKEESSFKFQIEVGIPKSKAHIHVGETTSFISIIEQFMSTSVFKTLALRKDSFRVGYVGNTILSLRRYYKNDWMGTHTSQTALLGSPIIAHTYSFDCKHSTKDNYLKVFETFKKALR